MKKIIGFAISAVLAMLLSAGCSNNREEFISQSYETDGTQISGIYIDVRDREIEVVRSDDSQIRIDYFESDKEYYDISVSDGKMLTMTAERNKEWTDYIGGKAPADVRKIVLQLPDGMLTSLSISTSNEDISLSSFCVKGDVSLTTNGGDIFFERLDAGEEICLSSKNGDIQGSVLGGYDDFSIQCSIKKGKSNLPSELKSGEKKLLVTVNNGDAAIDFQNE